MGRRATVAHAEAVSAVESQGSVSAAARSLGVSRQAVLRALDRADPAPAYPPGERRPVVLVAAPRVQLLAAQADAARVAVARGDRAAADRALGVVTHGLRLLASLPPGEG